MKGTIEKNGWIYIIETDSVVTSILSTPFISFHILVWNVEDTYEKQTVWANSECASRQSSTLDPKNQ